MILIYDGWLPHSITPLRTIGRGRAAEVKLVLVSNGSSQRIPCVEKVFAPGLLTRLIYRVAFQAPFAYQVVEDAILACYYRRRVAGAITDALGPSVRVARPLYVRWDPQAGAYVLGTEFISGRGIVPQAADPYMLRRWVVTRLRGESCYPPPPPQEVDQLLAVMTELEDLFRSSGLVGTGWQVCKRAIVSTANLLRTSDGYVVVDLESGIPAVLVPHYLMAGVRLGCMPLFDDVDPDRLRWWLQSHRKQLTQRLGCKGYAILCVDAERLIDHTCRWKEAEFALGRTKRRVFGWGLRERFKCQSLKLWRLRGLIDAPTGVVLRSSRRFFTRMIFLLGLVPGVAGRLLQRLMGNRAFRAGARRFFSDSRYRDRQLQEWVRRETHRWHEIGRIPPTRRFMRFDAWFLLHAWLARWTPRRLHRWLADPVHRRNMRVRAFLMLVSGRFQSEYGRYLIRQAIRQWELAGRLSAQEVERLHQQLQSSDLDEYVRCFALHVTLKLFFPLLAPIKVGGVAAFGATGDPRYLLPILLMPTLRTAITLWRMLAHRSPQTRYAEALLVGALPVVGSLAYPVQMYATHRELSTFLLRDSAARAGRWLPLYGAKDSRMELWAIKLINLVIEAIELALLRTTWLRRRLGGSEAVACRPRELPAMVPIGRWDRLAEDQLRLLGETEAAKEPIGTLVARLRESEDPAVAA